RQHSVGIPIRFAEGDNGTIDLIGYLDFWYPQHNLIVDLKTTSKAPSKWSLSHGIQAAVYQRAVKAMTGEMPSVKFLYCLTRKKDPFIWLEMEDPEYYLASFKRTVTQLERLLRLSDDSRDIIQAIPHNPDSFYWNGDDAIEISAQFYSA
ncbi:MAG: PD-(D/E)XK nuclease family protein, partial [Pseudomonadales bacterium]